MIQDNLSVEAKLYIDSLHFILCQSDDCTYEDEESMEGTWHLSAHIEWTNIAATTMKVIGFELSDWKQLADDYTKILTIALKSNAHGKLLLTICKDPAEFLIKIRGIIAKDTTLNF